MKMRVKEESFDTSLLRKANWLVPAAGDSRCVSDALGEGFFGG